MTIMTHETKADLLSTPIVPASIDALASPDVSRSTVLQVLTSPESMAGLFNARLFENGSDDLKVRQCRPRVLKKRLGSRQVVAYRLKITNGRPGKTKTIKLVGKRYADGDEGERAYLNTLRLWEAGFGNDSRLRIPKPLSYFADCKILVQENARGTLLMKHLGRGDHVGATRMRRVAHWLAKLHAFDGVIDGLESYEDETTAIKRFTSGLGERCPEMASDLVQLGRALSEKFASHSGCARAVVHGDFHPENVFVTRHGASVIDFDQIGISDPARDPGYFIAQMRATAFRVRGSLGASNAELQAFLDAYLDKSATADTLAVRIALFAALSFLESLFYIFCVLDSSQPEVLASYFGEIKRLIDVCNAGDIVA